MEITSFLSIIGLDRFIDRKYKGVLVDLPAHLGLPSRVNRELCTQALFHVGNRTQTLPQKQTKNRHKTHR